MKTIIKRLAVLTVLVLLFNSCTKDSIPSTPCTPIACLNGGTSRADCGCDCPQGFTGTNCGTQITPNQVKITNIRVTKFPDTKPNGSWWDTLPNSDADIKLTLQNSSQTTLWTSPTYYPDATGIGAVSYNFVPTTPIIITNLTSGYIMNIYDRDTLSDEFIDFVAFNPYNSSGGFPTTKTFTNASSTFSFELTLSYVW
ncbi:MAG: hypothetical protein K9I35_02645 [Flavobacterium sp.]|nr:hypothetical protein [Flavobacterium sp.]